jgi:hypothetical protein
MENHDIAFGVLVEYVANPIASITFTFESSFFSTTNDPVLSTTSMVNIFTIPQFDATFYSIQ